MKTPTPVLGLILLGALASCGDDGGDGSASPDASAPPSVDAAVEQHQVQVTVTGLRGDLQVTLNAGSEQTLTMDGSLALGSLDVGASYEVAIAGQPGIQDCVVTEGAGTIAAADVDIAISCDVLLFTTMTNGVDGMEWWKTDGTDAGTVMLANIGPGAANANIRPDYALLPRDFVVFKADDGTNGSQLWRSDGTTSGTTMVKIINSTGNGNPRDFIEFAGEVYFSANNGADGNELWKTDGSEVGTKMVKNIDGAAANSLASRFEAIVMGNALYFRARIEAEGYELWKSDGTTDGTVPVRDIYLGANDSSPANFAVMNDTLYFSAEGDALTGDELWKSDGTNDGTVIVKDVFTDADSSRPNELTVIGNTLYFAAYTGINDRLWKSDGTTDGTVEVRPTADGGPGCVAEMVGYAGKLYFSGCSSTDGPELWQSDGTPGGTTQIIDIQPGGILAQDPAAPQDFSLVPGGFVFTAYNEDLGRELWQSDGTEVGTKLIKDIDVGSGGYPIRWGRYSNVFRDFALYFADDGSSGMEPYRVNFDGAIQIKEVNPTGPALPNLE